MQMDADECSQLQVNADTKLHQINAEEVRWTPIHTAECKWMKIDAGEWRFQGSIRLD